MVHLFVNMSHRTLGILMGVLLITAAVLYLPGASAVIGTGLVMYFNRFFPDDLRTGLTFVHDWLALLVAIATAGHMWMASGDAAARKGMLLDQCRLSGPSKSMVSGLTRFGLSSNYSRDVRYICKLYGDDCNYEVIGLVIGQSKTKAIHTQKRDRGR